mmetsp:Transcript_4190/g.11053  ORF Transcript_4190/g.11053 Transcript_4190/m.11053 type:complete len:167 (-) Transcript_4190:166-666(-)
MALPLGSGAQPASNRELHQHNWIAATGERRVQGDVTQRDGNDCVSVSEMRSQLLLRDVKEGGRNDSLRRRDSANLFLQDIGHSEWASRFSFQSCRRWLKLKGLSWSCSWLVQTSGPRDFRAVPHRLVPGAKPATGMGLDQNHLFLFADERLARCRLFGEQFLRSRE